MYDRILVIGDIHGEFDKFLSLYEQLDFHPQQDLLIFLGDYIDRGDKSLQVLEWMYQHKDEKNIIMLRGNHEQMLLDYFSEHDTSWLWNGGEETLHDLQECSPDECARLLKFVKKLPLKFNLTVEEKEYFFCHAGVDPHIPLDLQDKDTLLWIRKKYFDHYHGQVTIVSGHTYVGYIELGATRPIVRDNMIFVDTGSYYPDGHISCIELFSHEIWQSK